MVTAEGIKIATIDGRVHVCLGDFMRLIDLVIEDEGNCQKSDGLTIAKMDLYYRIKDMCHCERSMNPDYDVKQHYVDVVSLMEHYQKQLFDNTLGIGDDVIHELIGMLRSFTTKTSERYN